ncbi:hypothetical protein ATO6_07170 [Oceanicola sp. 22II-s10i]|uniref:DUF1127 domain-containing protein n=1 Tax=Oceanicola sp. 22II-s10i TaxID=1317116 RepID=UPI000B527D94|nr:DUF1127 domain-containing protein [Oceanicola sp. 22II-s10i]OWU86558.1 hypothetical protein ATO6_07170 [Oceanicola sp. 22II-s10i]
MTTLTSRRSGYAPAGQRPASLIGRALSLLGLHQSRQCLSRLDDALLRDIGISREDAHKEARRPIWDVPTNWRA